ncbi:hypothetical protein Tco_0985851 [Tanacetum coccineum]
MNTKFVNNLPAYWGKYVTNVYEPHAKKTLKKQEQSTSIVDPLAYVAHTTSAPTLSSPSTPCPQPTAQSPNDALMTTMTQIANLLSGFQKQFPPTNNQLRTSSNSRTHATVHDGDIVTETIQRKAPVYVPPSSNCLASEILDLHSDREHTKTIKQSRHFLEPTNAIFEINKLRQQLQGKYDTIRNLDAQINIMKVLNVGTIEGSCDQQALETDRIQLKDTITSLRIQLDGLKVENVSLKRRYDELSKANTHSRTAYTEKLSAFTAEHTKLKAQVTGTTSSGPSTSETPKVLAPGMYNLGSKYIPPPKRANWVKPIPLPKQKQVTFSEPPKPSLKPTQKPVEHPNKQTNVCVPMSTGVKPTSGANKTVPKRAPSKSQIFVAVKSAKARRLNNVCAACNKSLVIANHTDCLVMCDGSVNVKRHQTKRFKRQPKKEWKPIKRVWKPISKPVANSEAAPSGSPLECILHYLRITF